MNQIPARIAPRLPEPPPQPPLPPEPRRATRAQRVTLLVGLALAALAAIQLFASILLPFVAAAGIAYFLDPLALRLTRAGMGVCQGRRCREQVACLLALGGHVPLGEVALATYRAPVRPLSLEMAGSIPEPPAMTAGWDNWFGIRQQFRHASELNRDV